MAAQSKNIVLVTGGNTGIGFEVVSQLMEKPNHVIIGSRSLEKGETALKALQARQHPGTAEVVQLDVSSYESIHKAAEEVKQKHGRIDVLVNNAGIAQLPDEIPAREQIQQCFTTNALGPYLMVEAFAPLLKASANPTPRIVNVSSGAGSITNRQKPSKGEDFSLVHYRASKAALNMINVCQAKDYGKLGWKVFAVCPGYTVSSLSGLNKTDYGAKPTSEGARIITRVVEGERDDEHGGFLKEEGQYEW